MSDNRKSPFIVVGGGILGACAVSLIALGLMHPTSDQPPEASQLASESGAITLTGAEPHPCRVTTVYSKAVNVSVVGISNTGAILFGDQASVQVVRPRDRIKAVFGDNGDHFGGSHSPISKVEGLCQIGRTTYILDYDGQESNPALRSYNPEYGLNTLYSWREGTRDGRVGRALFKFMFAEETNRLAVLLSGETYLAEQKVVRVISHGMVSTIGNRDADRVCVDGSGQGASFGIIESICSNGSKVYVLDDDHIREITPDNVVRTVAEIKSDSHVTALTVDHAGNFIFAVGEGPQRLYRLRSSGQLEFLAGGTDEYLSAGSDGVGQKVALGNVVGLAVDATDRTIAIADEGNSAIRVLRL